MSNQQAIENIEIGKQEAEKMVELGRAFTRLYDNPDFKAVIDKAYFEEEAQRLIMAKSNPQLQGELSQKNIDNQIMGVGCLKQFFIKIQMGAEQAADLIKEADDELELLRAEDAGALAQVQ